MSLSFLLYIYKGKKKGKILKTSKSQGFLFDHGQYIDNQQVELILRGLILAVGRMAMDRVAIYIYGKEMDTSVMRIRSAWMGLCQIQIMSTFSFPFSCPFCNNSMR